MPTLTPVEGDPFAQTQSKLTPVDHDPFAPGGPGQQARWLYAGFTVLAAASVVAAYKAKRGYRSSR